MPDDWRFEDFKLRLLDPVGDAEALHAIFGDEASSLYLPQPATASVEDTRSLLVRWSTGNESTSWAVVDAASRGVMGRVGLYRTSQPRVMGAACMIAPAGRGRNLAARALAIAIDAAFASGIARRIMADIDPDNAASERVFQTLGFTLEGRLRGEWETHIGVRDSLIYGLLAGDPRPWKA